MLAIERTHDLLELLKTALDKDASDLHLVRGTPPSLRVDGKITRLPGEALNASDIEQLVGRLLNERLAKRLERNREVDFSFEEPGLGRFRTSLFYERGSLAAAFRVVPWAIRSVEELGLPAVVYDLVRRSSGLVLVTGAVGMGKTTTLNTMIDLINSERPARIITIEDPIEFVHAHKVGMVLQREVRGDTISFRRALVAALRQDPNVICIGEMRDWRTISTALTAAETGHLVISTLHTQDTLHTLERIIDVFPPHQQAQVRYQLASVLQGLICQKLLLRSSGHGRALAYEVMLSTLAMRRLIRENKADQIPTVLQTGREIGMITMDQCIKNLYQAHDIGYEVARAAYSDPDAFKEEPWELA